MTVSLNDVIVGPTQLAEGVDTISLDFYLEDEDWIEVYKSGSETALVLATDYTVSGVGTSTGSITLTTAADGVDYYTVILKVPAERASDLQVRGGLRSSAFNAELDRLWQRIQYLDTLVNRALQVGKTSNAPGPLVAETAAERASKVLAFSSDGADLEAKNVADLDAAIFPASITDNAFLRADGATGKIFQSAQLVEDDSGNLTSAGTVNGRAMAADGAKLDLITVTQASNLDLKAAEPLVMGSWDASSGSFPGGGTANQWDGWVVSVAGTVDGETFAIGDLIVAFINNPSTATFAGNWLHAANSPDVAQYTGTWTPALSFGGATTGITYSSATGLYWVTGSQVAWTFNFTLTSKGTATGNAEVTIPPLFAFGKTIRPYMGGGFMDTYWSLSGLTGGPALRALTSKFRLTQEDAANVGDVTDANFTNTSQIVCAGFLFLQ